MFEFRFRQDRFPTLDAQYSSIPHRNLKWQGEKVMGEFQKGADDNQTVPIALEAADVSRRDCLAAVGGLIAASLVVPDVGRAADPAEHAGQNQSIRGPFETPGVEFILQARVTISPMIDIGQISYGHRRIIPITGGEFHGPRLSGTVLDEGEDTQLVRPDGITEIVARYILRTHDGVLIYIVNRGMIAPGPDVDGHGGRGRPSYVRTIPKFEAPLGSHYEWMNRALYVGTLHPLPPAEHAVVVRFFKVT